MRLGRFGLSGFHAPASVWTAGPGAVRGQAPCSTHQGCQGPSGSGRLCGLGPRCPSVGPGQDTWPSFMSVLSGGKAWWGGSEGLGGLRGGAVGRLHGWKGRCFRQNPPLHSPGPPPCWSFILPDSGLTWGGVPCWGAWLVRRLGPLCELLGGLEVVGQGSGEQPLGVWFCLGWSHETVGSCLAPAACTPSFLGAGLTLGQHLSGQALCFSGERCCAGCAPGDGGWEARGWGRVWSWGCLGTGAAWVVPALTRSSPRGAASPLCGAARRPLRVHGPWHGLRNPRYLRPVPAPSAGRRAAPVSTGHIWNLLAQGVSDRAARLRLRRGPGGSGSGPLPSTSRSCPGSESPRAA